VRVLARAVVTRSSNEDGFFLQLGGGAVDIRERIARYLDAALFESVIAAEVRSLSGSGSFERLFDLFSQLVGQVISYRWLALLTHQPTRLALHHHPQCAGTAEREARVALGEAEGVVLYVVDEDPRPEPEGPAALTCPVTLGAAVLGQLALAPSADSERGTQPLLALIARELGGPLRIASLMDQQEQLATIDALTMLRNRRAFVEVVHTELARAGRYELPLSLVLLDIDHFKSINDTHGHAAGDQVLSSIGRLLGRSLRTSDVGARWGGEEFVLALTSTALAGAAQLAERLRTAVRELQIAVSGEALSVSASLGVAEYRPGEPLEALVDRADRAMYEAKASGRDRVIVADNTRSDVHGPKLASLSQLRRAQGTS
jgi:two-component system cell cycle response regulator